VRVSIDIVEEYNTTVLGDYRQEEERNEKKDTPGWIGTSTRGTLQLDSPEKHHSSTLIRLDWGINIGKYSNYSATAAEQTKLPRQSTSSCLGSRRRNTIMSR